MACAGWGYQVSVAPQMSDYDRDQRLRDNKPVAWKVFIHELTGTNQCPTDDQLDQIDALREEDKPGPDTRMQHWLNPANRRPAPSAAAAPASPVRNTSPTEGDTMTTAQSGEVTGLASAINYADAVAAAHAAHSQGGGEQYRASLGEAGVGPETIRSAATAQEASEIAAGAWKAHADKLREQEAAKEATTAETGTKDFLLAE